MLDALIAVFTTYDVSDTDSPAGLLRYGRDSTARFDRVGQWLFADYMGAGPPGGGGGPKL